MRLSALHVGELARELAPLLVGLRVKDLEPRPPRDLLLVLAPEDGEGGVRRVRVSVDPDAPRVHLQTERERRYEGPAGPFFQRLARELVGARLAELAQVRGDRILRLAFDTADGKRALFVELAGRHGNLALADGADLVLDVLVPAPAGKPARLAPGAVWAPPPGAPPADPGPALAELLPPPDGAPAAPLSRRVELALGAAARERDEARERASLRQRLERRAAAAANAVAGLERRRAAVDEAERVRRDGELLKSELGRVKRGMREVVVTDWFTDGAPRAIALDPKLGPRENLERWFARYQKLARSGEALEREVELAGARRVLLEGLLARVDAEPPAQLEEEAVAAGLLEPIQRRTHRDPAKQRARLPYKVFSGCRGGEIRVGRTARDNDALTTRHARGNDLWMHAADSPGSHVVLRLERGREPDPEEVLDAAHLAVHFSPLRGARRAGVSVARAKEVHKPKGAKPGLVVLSGGKRMDLRIEPERLARLLSGERAPAEDPDA